MYLKSIEIHGFKSFANRIKFEFHDGITGIVGPNGSGKSNVADAVRWVLGEQSAKQLRGSNMSDVIFSGSEARKPLGYAFVEITFDNRDHQLAVSFDEVSVARRVYRSGESEYLINGNICRLRDVQEMFMDTGIGKEGYSIIGQGQIDRILSTKPEDRRELFDEAAGIVKFKKRKAIAEKNLADARDNLDRIMDIINEIEGRIEPLEKQSEAAKEYLRLKEILKRLEVNSFLREYEKFDGQVTAIEEKLEAANNDLTETQRSNENARAEYERLDASLEDYNKALEEGRSYRSELLLDIEKKEGEIKLFEQQLIAISQNGERIDEQINGLNEKIKAYEKELSGFSAGKADYENKLKEVNESGRAAVDAYEKLRTDMQSLTKSIEDSNNNILKLVNDSVGIKTDITKNEALLEQITIRRSELQGKLLSNRSVQEESKGISVSLENEKKGIDAKIAEKNKELSEKNVQLAQTDDKLLKLRNSRDEVQRDLIGERSRLESLQNIAERYENYSSAVKKLMEVRDSFPGIDGVVAELINVDKKYETAVETALGASIQHIVTTDEDTAKCAIEYLKKNKFGRATFLPVTSVGRNRQDVPAEAMKAKGVIGSAATLVKADSKYSRIIDHLLRSFIVVDNIDNALKLAASYDYSLRIVTIEGEQLAPGGSIAGGSFKLSSNLLGRKREIAELEEKTATLSGEYGSLSGQIDALILRKKTIREEIDSVRSSISELMLDANSVKMKLEKENQHAAEISNKAEAYREELSDLEEKAQVLKKSIDRLNERLIENNDLSSSESKSIDENNGRLLELKFGEGEALEKVNALRIEAANIEQAGHYTEENIIRINSEISAAKDEKKRIEDSRQVSRNEISEKNTQISDNRSLIVKFNNKISELDKNIEDLITKKETMTIDHKSFLDSWSALGNRVTELEKEVMRLTNQKDKLAEQRDAQISYVWDEYRLTVSSAEDFRDPDFKVSSARKEIQDTKASIRELGDVNVNSIEEYREVSERYKLLSGQRDDLLSSQESIVKIIEELDAAMREQFTSSFRLIRQEFNTVFRELFGGGKGELELIEDEDMLEAGIRIIAQPPGKKLQNMMQLSGGEKALTAIALLFAIQNLKPSPFCLLDEIEAALDDSNVKRFSNYLKKLTKNSQFIVITHRRGTMAAADVLYGITMQEKGVSTLVSVNMIEANLDN